MVLEACSSRLIQWFLSSREVILKLCKCSEMQLHNIISICIMLLSWLSMSDLLMLTKSSNECGRLFNNLILQIKWSVGFPHDVVHNLSQHTKSCIHTALLSYLVIAYTFYNKTFQVKFGICPINIKWFKVSSQFNLILTGSLAILQYIPYTYITASK